MPSQSASPKPLKIFIFAIDGVGHINACVGIAQALAKRGHQIYFLLNEAFKGQFAKFGFEEVLLKKAPPENAGADTAAGGPPKNPVKEMADQLLSLGIMSEKTPLEKLKFQGDSSVVFMAGVTETLAEFNPQIGEAIEREKPDLFILDHLMVPPALSQWGVPWMQLFSGNPLNLYQSDKLPPFGAGFAVDADPASWQEFKQLQEEKFISVVADFQQKLNARFNYSPPEEPTSDSSSQTKSLIRFSKYLNIYGYPEELDYHDVVPRPANLAHVDAFIREVPEPFQLPEEFASSPGDKLIYVSLGSLGSVDVNLMKRVTSILAKSPHKFIVSKGPRAEEYELPPNCWGEAFLPQANILPLVDLVITHGGNNTITETFSSGKPMIVLPLFADQYDNAQRVTEKGYGARLATYTVTEQELLSTIDRLLADKQMNQKCQAAALRIAGSNSKERVAIQIEQVVEEAKSGKKFV